MSQLSVLIVALCQLLAAYQYGVYAHGTYCDNFKFRIKNTHNKPVNVRIISPCNFYYDWEMDYRHKKHIDFYKMNHYASKKSKPCVNVQHNCAWNGNPECMSDPYYNYVGLRARTKDQWACEVWSQSKLAKNDTDVIRGFNGVLPNHNLCRNPNNQSGPWCYTKEYGFGGAPPSQNCYRGCGEGHDQTCFKEGYGHVQCAFNGKDSCKRQGSYGGTRSRTKNHWQCQVWFVAFARGQMSNNIRTSFGSRIPNHNFCRNPGNASVGPWCYTADKEGPDFEYCFATCENAVKDEVRVAEHPTHPCVFSSNGVGDGNVYGGKHSKTYSPERHCLPWNTVEGNLTAEAKSGFNNHTPTHNYCRNPDHCETGPWCFYESNTTESPKMAACFPECGSIPNADSRLQKLKYRALCEYTSGFYYTVYEVRQFAKGKAGDKKYGVAPEKPLHLWTGEESRQLLSNDEYFADPKEMGNWPFVERPRVQFERPVGPSPFAKPLLVKNKWECAWIVENMTLPAAATVLAVKTPTHLNCCSSCRGQVLRPGCMFWTWSKTTQMCYLKGKIPFHEFVMMDKTKTFGVVGKLKNDDYWSGAVSYAPLQDLWHSVKVEPFVSNNPRTIMDIPIYLSTSVLGRYAQEIPWWQTGHKVWKENISNWPPLWQCFNQCVGRYAIEVFETDPKCVGNIEDPLQVDKCTVDEQNSSRFLRQRVEVYVNKDSGSWDITLKQKEGSNDMHIVPERRVDCDNMWTLSDARKSSPCTQAHPDLHSGEYSITACTPEFWMDRFVLDPSKHNLHRFRQMKYAAHDRVCLCRPLNNIDWSLGFRADYCGPIDSFVLRYFG